MSKPPRANFGDDVDPWELLDQGCLDDPFFQQIAGTVYLGPFTAGPIPCAL